MNVFYTVYISDPCSCVPTRIRKPSETTRRSFSRSQQGDKKSQFGHIECDFQPPFLQTSSISRFSEKLFFTKGVESGFLFELKKNRAVKDGANFEIHPVWIWGHVKLGKVMKKTWIYNHRAWLRIESLRIS